MPKKTAGKNGKKTEGKPTLRTLEDVQAEFEQVRAALQQINARLQRDQDQQQEKLRRAIALDGMWEALGGDMAQGPMAQLHGETAKQPEPAGAGYDRPGQTAAS